VTGLVPASELDAGALFHLASGEEWAAYQESGTIAPDSLDTEGFVHCSWGRQVAGTVEKHFAGRTDLVALRLDPEAVEAPLLEEDSYGSGQAFPHVHGPIPVVAVVEAVPLA
jgi:glutathione S-transferase